MATLAEIGAITSEAGWGAFHQKVRAAVVIKAAAVLDSTTPTQAQIDWAQAAIKNPTDAGNDIVFYVIGTNSSVSIAGMLGANDSAIQTNVNAAVDVITGA